MNETGSSSGHENSAGLLAKLLNQLNLPTLAVVLFMGGGNWWETKSGNDFNALEIKRATQEIHDLYPKLDEAVTRQKRMQESLDRLLSQHTNP